MDPSFVTLKKADERFHKYLNGSFSDTRRALPVESMNVSTDQEQVTFRLVDISDIQRPSWAVVLFRLLRVEWLTLGLSPLLVTWWFLAIEGYQLRAGAMGLSLLAVTCFHAAVFLFNDYYDYLNGADRISHPGVRNVISQGWLTAQFVRRVALCCLLVGVAAGLPLVLQQPATLLFVALFSFMGVVGYSYRNLGFKYLGLAEFVVFFCFGPLLVYGASRAAALVHPLPLIGVGAVFGHWAVVCVQLRQLENVMSDDLANIKTFAARVGFDRAKLFLQLQFILQWALFSVVAFMVSGRLGLAFGLVYGLTLVPGFRKLRAARSSLSSELRGLHLWAGREHLLLSLLMLGVLWLSR